MVDDKDVEEPGKKQRGFFRLGPLAVLISFAVSASGTVFADLIVYRTCLVSFGYNATECIILRANSSSPEAVELEAKVEPYATVILMTKSLMDSLLPAVLSLFLGPWSDRGGRRPLLLAGYSGFTVGYFMLWFMCDWNISPWYLLLAWIPVNITGGLCTIVLASICFISDTTTPTYRMRQLSLLDATVAGGDVLGGLIGPLIYVNFGYINSFRTSAICCALALLYVYIFIPESVKNTSKESLRGLFKIALVKELITSSSVKRNGFRRSVVWLGISTFTLFTMIRAGYNTILFLFTRVRLGWDIQYYSYYFATSTVLRITGLGIASLLSPVLELSDTSLAGIGIVATLAGAITKSFAWKSWHMYLSVCIEIFWGIVGPAMRSVISKSVPAQDVGKVLSLTAFLEAAGPLAGAPLYTLIYTHYLPPIYPSPVHLLTTSFCILSMIFVAFSSVLLRKSGKLTKYVAASQDDTVR